MIHILEFIDFFIENKISENIDFNDIDTEDYPTDYLKRGTIIIPKKDISILGPMWIDFRKGVEYVIFEIVGERYLVYNADKSITPLSYDFILNNFYIIN